MTTAHSSKRGNCCSFLRAVIAIALMAVFCSCESKAEAIARYNKEQAEARASAARWSAIESFLVWAVAAAAAGKIGLTIYKHHSKSNTTRRMIAEKKDYAAALRLELKACDYAGIHSIIETLGLPGGLQTQLVLASVTLQKVCHLSVDARNTFIPQPFREQILASAHQTYERLFQWIARVVLLKDSHFGACSGEQILSSVVADVRAVNCRLDVCLSDIAIVILHPPAAGTSAAALDGMQGILSALREADRLLA